VVLAQAVLTERLRRCPDDRIARFILDFTLHGFAFGAAEEGGGIVLHDPLAMAVALDPSLVTFEPMSVEVECEGKLTRGLSLADRRGIPSHRKRVPGCRVAMDVDADAVLRLFLERLCPASA
jgi:inosine-uridine nucleoside N-ribohydrolase